MLKFVKVKKSVRKRDENFEKLREGSLFNDGKGKHFLVTRKPFGDVICVIELTHKNCLNLINCSLFEIQSLEKKDLEIINLLQV